MTRNIQRLTVVVAMLTGAAVLHAATATLETSLAEAGARRKAAENRLGQIKSTSSQSAEAARALYGDAAAKNNAWVDAVCRTIEEGTKDAPDVSSLAEPAAASLLAWVSGLDKALGNPESSAAIADGSRKQVIQNLTDVAAKAWQKNRALSAEKRRQASAALRARLQWKTLEQLP